MCVAGDQNPHTDTRVLIDDGRSTGKECAQNTKIQLNKSASHTHTNARPNRKRESVCVRERERERERQSACVRLSVCACVH